MISVTIPGRPMPPFKFWQRVRVDDTGCWLWTGARSGGRYGALWDQGRNRQAHRLAYEWLVGPIPEGLTLDHLCRVHHCVNPNHLEPVTHRENVLRGISPAALAAKQTHCIHGHPFDEANTFHSKKQRICLECGRERSRRRRREAKQ